MVRNVPKLLFLGQDWAPKVCRFSVLFGYLRKSEEKPISERSELFRPRSGQASEKFATGPAQYKNRTKDFFEILL